MTPFKYLRLTALILATLAPQAALAQWLEPKSEHYEEEQPWQELQATLPAATPQADSLVRIDMGPAAPHRYFVDQASVTVGADGVVRYSMVVESRGGARNISYEGMRCASGEWKSYAFGRRDGSWSTNKYARWATIKDRQASSYHRELFYHYFCTVDGAADLQVIRRALAEGGLRRGQEVSF